ncbi:hypothetical protein [Vreelandella nanhaiensis]|uniref:Uncharacterized protein n=1 Tax=Vreelandella nanhaiensis TaxID=1258546 RepID=A0A3S0YKR4_9GAMM|nr:hypothetical protein [Halomonas nanhaiensis]RUR32646.1 hypothetical protein ELY38_07460 [Halomonas nanhaiensis]
MSMIDQLRDGKTKAFAKHCYESHSAEDLRAAAEGPADHAQIEHWEISEGQWEEAVAAALADHEAKE